MSIKSTLALLTLAAAAAALPAPALAASTVACTLDGRQTTTRSESHLLPTVYFSAAGSAICTGVAGGQLVNPRATPFRLEGHRTTLLGQPCAGSGQALLTLRVLKRTGWVPLRTNVRMATAQAGTFDGATRLGRDAVSLLGTTDLSSASADCTGAFTARFTLTPAL